MAHLPLLQLRRTRIREAHVPQRGVRYVPRDDVPRVRLLQQRLEALVERERDAGWRADNEAAHSETARPLDARGRRLRRHGTRNERQRARRDRRGGVARLAEAHAREAAQRVLEDTGR